MVVRCMVRALRGRIYVAFVNMINARYKMITDKIIISGFVFDTMPS